MLLSIEQIIKQSTQRLEHSSDSAKLDVELLLAHSLNKDRTYLFTWHDKIVAEENVTVFNALLARRLSGEPIAYILGQQEFWDLKLHTAQHTLIPRADTETLIEWVLELADQLPESAHVIDLGTGTGAIALALANEFPHWQVQGVDLVPEAVALAKSNAILNNLERVQFFQSRWFDQVGIGGNHDSFDLIVSNPPYIDPLDEDSNLHYYNQFSIKAPTDYIKYIMLVMKEFSLNQRTQKVVIWGNMTKKSEHFKLFTKYIGNIGFGPRPSHLKFNYHFDELADQQYFDLFSVFLCD